MKRFFSIIVLAVILTCMVGTAYGKTWKDYSSEIKSNAETMIKDLRDAYNKNDGKLSKRDIELLYRYYQLWISAKQINLMATVDYNTIVVMDTMDPYATSQKAAAETWETYIRGEIDAMKMAELLVILTSEIEN